MKTFAIKFKSNFCDDIAETVGHLFLSTIPVSQVGVIIDALKKRKTTCAKIKELAEIIIPDFSTEFMKKREFQKRMNKRKNEWCKMFGEIDENDMFLIKKLFNISETEIFGYPDFKSPAELSQYIKGYIKGQDKAIEELCCAFFAKYAQIKHGISAPSTKPVIICGPTGCGKTYALSLLSDICNCPAIYINTSSITATGWRGSSIFEVIADQAKKYPLSDLKKGIIYVDEIDKIVGTHSPQDNELCLAQMRDLMSLTDPAQSIRVASGLNANAEQSFFELPVNELLIVFSGVFNGLQDIIHKRLNQSKIGFNSYVTNLDETATIEPCDLIKFGFLDEFIGRIGSIIRFDKLSADTMRDVLMNARNSILQQHLIYNQKLYNSELKFTESALKILCEYASSKNLGFRAVNNALEICLNKIRFNIPIMSDKEGVIMIDEKDISQQLNIR